MSGATWRKTNGIVITDMEQLVDDQFPGTIKLWSSEEISCSCDKLLIQKVLTKMKAIADAYSNMKSRAWKFAAQFVTRETGPIDVNGFLSYSAAASA